MFTGHELGSLRVSFSVDLITYQISSYACELFNIDVYYETRFYVWKGNASIFIKITVFLCLQ